MITQHAVRRAELPCCGAWVLSGDLLPHVGSKALVACEQCGTRWELTRRSSNIDALQLKEAS